MKRRTFLSALVGAGTVAATTSYIARHMTPPPPKAQDMSRYCTSKDAWYLLDYPGITRVVRQRTIMHGDWRAIYGSSGL
jgi:hypothetical protein